MLRIKNIRVDLDDTRDLREIAAAHLGISAEKIRSATLRQRAVDARRYRGAKVHFVLTIDVDTAQIPGILLARCKRQGEVEEILPADIPRILKYRRGAYRPIVAGFGPAGIFVALSLARAGCAPLVLERGRDADRRYADICRFWGGGAFSPASNVQFGEGGAGTFSDGKLTTRVSDSRGRKILEDFVAAGAPEEILHLQKPHIGTDILRDVVKRLRAEILRLGGEIRFEAQVTGIARKGGRLCAVFVNGAERIATDTAFFAIGHSARDTYEMLDREGVAMEAKPFAVGVRIEHPQSLIDERQYGEAAGHPKLPVADYALTFQDRTTGRGAYSFCMCPGGQVVAAASEEGHLVTNGMSCYRRNSGVANAALLVQVTPKDFGDGALAGIAFQRKYEEIAFRIAGGDYYAPVQSVGDFLSGKKGARDFCIAPSYLPGVRAADLREALPPYVAETLSHALGAFERKIPGFAASDIPMTGVETRSSAPCRILRGKEDFVSISLHGLYPVGEGAGYAGGIMSAAMDGMKAAEQYLKSMQMEEEE